MNKKHIIIGVSIIIILAIIFFPKSSTEGPAEGGLHSEIKEYSKKECNCIGFHKWIGPMEKSDDHVCYGIPLCKTICREKVNNNWKDIPCDQMP